MPENLVQVCVFLSIGVMKLPRYFTPLGVNRAPLPTGSGSARSWGEGMTSPTPLKPIPCSALLPLLLS